MTQTAGVPARTQDVELPDRSMFWAWVWSAVRPVLGWVLAAAGAIALLVGWYGVSGESLTAKQLPYLVSAGLTGIALFIMAGVFLATDDVRRQFARIAELERKVDDLYSLFVADLAPTAATAAPAAVQTPQTRRGAATDVVALPAGSSYHRPDCALVAGKSAVVAVDPDAISRRGLRPCRVCDPPPAGA
jgi:hypothetical protein